MRISDQQLIEMELSTCALFVTVSFPTIVGSIDRAKINLCASPTLACPADGIDLLQGLDSSQTPVYLQKILFAQFMCRCAKSNTQKDAIMGSSYKAASGVTLTFETDYTVENGGKVALIGSLSHLGEWNPQKCILAEEQPPNSNHWKAQVVLPKDTVFLWKWIIVSPGREKVYRWEEGENRQCSTERSDVCWEAAWNKPAICNNLVTPEKTSNSSNTNSVVTTSAATTEEQTNGQMNGDAHAEVPAQPARPTSLNVIEKIRGRLCILI